MKYELNKTELDFIELNKILFKTVIDFNQPIQESNDLVKKVIQIYERITGEQLKRNCSNCLFDAFVIVKIQFNLQNTPLNETETKKSKKK